MSSLQRSWRTARLGGVLLLLCTRLHLLGCGRDVEFACEEAAQALADCCGGATALKCEAIDVRNVDSGCGSTHVYVRHVDPGLLPDSALCVRGASCAALQRAGLCELESFLLLETCTTTADCTGSGWGRTCDTTRTCTTPAQDGDCTGYRPAQTCAAMAQLGCR